MLKVVGAWANMTMVFIYLSKSLNHPSINPRLVIFLHWHMEERTLCRIRCFGTKKIDLLSVKIIYHFRFLKWFYKQIIIYWKWNLHFTLRQTAIILHLVILRKNFVKPLIWNVPVNHFKLFFQKLAKIYTIHPRHILTSKFYKPN